MCLQIEISKNNQKSGNLFDNLSTWHGIVYLVQKNKIKRRCWIFLMIGNIIFTAYLMCVVKIQYDSNQIYTRVDSTCRVNQVPFPSVIICNSNYASLRETSNIKQILMLHDRNDTEINNFFAALGTLTNFGYRSDTVGHFSDIMNILKRHYFSMDAIMEEVHQKCKNLLLHCQFNGKTKKCGEVFKLIKTFEGYCCAFNYAALNDASENTYTDDNEDIEYYDDRKIGAIIATSKSGRSSGLSVLFDVEMTDYPSWSNFNFYGARIIISDPNDFPETTVLTKYIEPGESMDMMVEPLIFLSDDNLRRVTVKQRNCWFHDEMEIEHTDRYSFETCQTECLMHTYQNNCGCVPYMYPRDSHSRICELSDVACLHRLKVYDSNDTCECFLECNDKKYRVKQNVVQISAESFPESVTQNLTLPTLCSLKVYFDKSTCNCYKKTLLVEFNRIIGTYGGVFSLCAGGSILTIVEVIYVLIIRLLPFLYRFSETVSDARYNKVKVKNCKN